MDLGRALHKFNGPFALDTRLDFDDICGSRHLVKVILVILPTLATCMGLGVLDVAMTCLAACAVDEKLAALLGHCGGTLFKVAEFAHLGVATFALDIRLDLDNIPTNGPGSRGRFASILDAF